MRDAWAQYQPEQNGEMYAPLLAGDHIVGIIQVTAAAPRLFEAEDLRLLTALAEIAGSALHRAGLLDTLEQRVERRTRQLALANERLQELDRMKSKFVSDVSHELRTPTTNLLLYLDLYERRRHEPERGERYLQVLRKQAVRLNLLLDQILSLSRLELRDQLGDFFAVDLNRLAGDSVEALAAEIQAAQLALRFEPGAGLPLIWGQPQQVRRLLDNVLSNAVNYTPTSQITVTTSREGAGVLLAVEDTGVGIAPEDLPQVFERFCRGRWAAQSTIPGTGLGLALVQEIVNLHQGRIAIASEPDTGTRVEIWLPAAGSPDRSSTNV